MLKLPDFELIVSGRQPFTPYDSGNPTGRDGPWYYDPDYGVIQLPVDGAPEKPPSSFGDFPSVGSGSEGKFVDGFTGQDANSASRIESLLSSFNSSLDDMLSGVNTSAETANQVAQANTKTAQEFAIQQMRTSAELERYLRSTAYQDTVKSLKEAGLNPMLAYMNGPISASAPTASVSASQTFKQDTNKADEILAVAKLISNLFGSIVSAFKK